MTIKQVEDLFRLLHPGFEITGLVQPAPYKLTALGSPFRDDISFEITLAFSVVFFGIDRAVYF